MTNLTLDVNIIDFPSIPVAMLPHRCSPELLNYSVAKFIMWRKETGLSPVNQSQTFWSRTGRPCHHRTGSVSL